jgi:hypothetical protein
MNITVPSGLDSKSLEALQKAVFEFSGGDAGLKSDMSQYQMQLHVCGDSHGWCTLAAGVDAAFSTSSSCAKAGSAGTYRSRTTLVGSDDTKAAASTHSHQTVAATAAVQQQMLLHAVVLSLQTVKTLRSDIECAPIFCLLVICFGILSRF